LLPSRTLPSSSSSSSSSSSLSFDRGTVDVNVHAESLPSFPCIS
jgi:hypothetical protein